MALLRAERARDLGSYCRAHGKEGLLQGRLRGVAPGGSGLPEELWECCALAVL